MEAGIACYAHTAETFFVCHEEEGPQICSSVGQVATAACRFWSKPKIMESMRPEVAEFEHTVGIGADKFLQPGPDWADVWRFQAVSGNGTVVLISMQSGVCRQVASVVVLRRGAWIRRWSVHLWVEPMEGGTGRHKAYSYVHRYSLCSDVESCTKRLAPFEASRRFNRLCEKGLLRQALRSVQLAVKQGTSLSVNKLCAILKGCMKKGDLAVGRQVQDLVEKSALQSGVVNNHLIRMYASCGRLSESSDFFCRLALPTVYEWAAIISAHGKNGQPEQAIKLYHRMRQTNLEPNDYVFVAALEACCKAISLTDGKLIHSHAREHWLETNYFVCSTLIHMYAKCGSLDDAREVFDRLPRRDRVTWTAMITGYAQHGDGELALRLFQQMHKEGIQPDKVTIISALNACSSIAAWDYGNLLHRNVTEGGFECDTSVANSLMDMYVKCNSLEKARAVFDGLRTKDVVSWTSMIGGYTECGNGEEALVLFRQMAREHVEPNKVTHMSMLKACASAAALDYGKLLHNYIMESSLASDVTIGNTLIHMYAKCGCLADARLVFDRLPTRDLVTWNAMLAGYAQQGSGQETLQLFRQMQREQRLQPNRVTFVSVLKACSSVASLDQGKLIHAHISENGLEADVHVGSTLVDMYAKCGSLEDACSVFQRLPRRSLVSWNAMIAGYAQEGDGEKALQLFRMMQKEGFLPDKVTLLCLLSACSRAGLKDDGYRLFQSMSEEFGVIPEMEHYACMVDLLSRAGYLEEAETFIQNMPSQPDVVVWMCLLGACRDYGNVELAQRVFDLVLRLDPTNAAAYVLMSNLYSSTGRWEEKTNIMNLMHHAGVKKEPGRTWIELQNQVHTFVVDDMEHPERKQIYVQLRLVLDTISQEFDCPVESLDSSEDLQVRLCS